MIAAPEIPLLDVNTLPAEQAIGQLIGYAVKLKASDLFLGVNEQHVTVQVRHMGILRPMTVLSLEAGRRIISLVKTRASMDLAERRRPLDGRWIYLHDDGGVWDLRINSIPTVYGEDLAIRLLAREAKTFTLDNLGLTRPQRSMLAAMIESPGGLILFTGPTGSGKTATLYACLKQLNDGKRKINTIEDPVEYTLEGIRQSQVNPAIDLGFSELLRSVMRQAPDVIMIGEIRDEETAEIAIRAANSGHLVLATIHATAAAGAVQSMRALDVHPHFLGSALRGIVAQRLVRTLCPKCRAVFDLTDAPHTFDDVRSLLAPGEGQSLYAPRGCPECFASGYSGRTGVFEVLSITRSLRNLISDNVSVRDLRHKAVQEQMLEFRHAAMLKVAHGQTSTEEVFRVIPSEHLIAEE
jgi:general secretion pathway protein E